MLTRKIAWVCVVSLMLVVGESCNKKSTSGPTQVTETTANGSSFVLSCAAVWPKTANGSSITIACSTGMNLSSITTANGTAIYACANPTQLPQTFNASSVNLISTAICSSSASCSGPTNCSGTLNGGTASYGCGSILPSTINGASISITCSTITDLSGIQTANGTDISMCSVPCKLPRTFNNSTITVDTSICGP